MKIAIISITNQGKNVSNQLYNELLNDPLITQLTQYHKNVKNVIKKCFNEYDCIIGIMASGIMIRSIAPYVNSKLTDPAILLIDDNANNVISLLSGHFGGANQLCVKIAKLLNSNPVITTSTDINNKVGIDSIAKTYYCKLENSENIKYINKALVDNNVVDLYLPSKYSYILTDDVNKSYNVHMDNTLELISSVYEDHEVILKPLNIVMGIGSRKNIATDKVSNAIIQACDLLGFRPERIDSFATVDIKKNEEGILSNVNKYGKKLHIVTQDEIKNFNNDECSKSEFVMKQFGIRGVCEPACLITNVNEPYLIFKKTAYDGVTIAVSISKY